MPISVAHYLLQFSQGQLQHFAMDEENLYFNKENYSSGDVIESVLHDSSTLVFVACLSVVK